MERSESERAAWESGECLSDFLAREGNPNGPLPGGRSVLGRLVQEIDDPDRSARSLANVCDAALAEAVIALTKTTFYRAIYKRSTFNLVEAVGRIGEKGLLSLVCAREFFRSAPMPGEWSHGWNPNQFSNHSILVANIARRLAQDLESDVAGSDLTPDEYHLAGLLHDIGRLSLATWYPEIFGEMLSALQSQPDWTMNDVEPYVLKGWTHADLSGYHVSARLGLHTVSTPIALHHRPYLASGEKLTPSSILHLADGLANSYLTPAGSRGDWSLEVPLDEDVASWLEERYLTTPTEGLRQLERFLDVTSIANQAFVYADIVRKAA